MLISISTELTPSTTSRSPSPRRNNHSRERNIRPHPRPQEEIPPRRPPSPQNPLQDTTSSQTNPPNSTSPPLTFSNPTLTETAYPPLRKKPSITMPGSLFPRSDSLEPEHNQEDLDIRRMRFLSASEDDHDHEQNLNPLPRTSAAARESEPGPSKYQPATPADEIGPSPWRTRPISSVHDAVQRFTASGGEERDFSLLVAASPAGPIRPESPGITVEKSLSGGSRKGKERAVDDGGNGDEDLAFRVDPTSGWGSGHAGRATERLLRTSWRIHGDCRP